MAPCWAAEEAAINGFLPLRQVVLDDWLLRFSGGGRRTANSVTPLREPRGDLNAVIDTAEMLYRAERQPTIFRLPSFLAPEIDRRLAERGYTAEGESCIIEGPLDPIVTSAAPFGGAGAVRLQNQLAAAATRRASTIRFLPWQPARRSKKSPLHARALARTMSAPQLPGTSGPAASKSATGSSLPHSRPGRSNASRSEAGIKKSVGRLRREPVDVFASLRCSVDRASPSATHEVSSNVVRVAGRLTGTDGSNPCSSTGDSYKPDHSDRSGCRATSSSGNRGMSVDRGKHKYDHS